MVFKIDQVGIGTSSPGELLQVDGNIKVRTNNNDDLYLKGSSLYRHFISNSTDVGSGIHFTNAAILPTNYAGIYHGQGGTIDFGSTARRFKTLFSTGLDVSGDVGIGTVSPRGKLDIYTASTATAGLIIDRALSGTYRTEFYQESNGLAIKCGDGSNAPVEIMRLMSSGVGIGTTTPVAKLHMASNGPTYTAIGGNDRFRIEELVSNGNKFGLQMGIDWSTGHSALQTYALSSGGSYSQDYSLLLQPHGGNVGIGTTSPGRALEVYTGDGNVPGLRLRRGAGSAYTDLRHATSPDGLAIHTSDGNATTLEVMRVCGANGGRVGIGTTDPHGQLHIGPKDDNHIYLASSNNTYGWKLDTDDQTNGDVPFRIIKRTGGADTTVLTIKNQDGYVGIGESSPAQKLDVDGRIRANSMEIDGFIYHVGDTDTSFGFTGADSFAVYTGNSQQLLVDSIGLQAEAFVKAGDTNTMMTFPALDNIAFMTNSTDRLRIDSSGNVGIGTTTPFGKLDVRGAIIAPVVSYTSNQDAAYLIASATTYTGATTHWGTHGFQHRIKSDSGGNPRITVDDGNGDEVFTIKNGGHVGIGTTSPDNKLEVRGNLTISGSDTDSMRIDGGSGVIRHKWTINSSTYGSGLYLSDNVILPTNYLGSTTNLGIFLGSTSNRWHTIYTGTLNTSETVHVDMSTTTSGNPSSTGIQVHNANTGDATLALRVKDSSSGDPFIGFEIVNEYGWSLGVDNNDSNKFKLARSWSSLTSSTALTVSTDGYVGIGRTDPGYLLDVNGTSRFANLLQVNRVKPYSSTNSAAYTAAAIEVREYNLECAAGGYGYERAPRIAFHWCGRVASQLICENSGRISVLNNPGTGYEKFGCGDFYSSGKMEVTGGQLESMPDRFFLATGSPGHWNMILDEDDDYNYDVSIKATYYIRGQGLLATSDERVKTDIQTLDTGIALSKLDKIRPVSYKMKNTGEFMFGFIGQEIEKELPNVVNKDSGIVADFNIMGVFSNKQSIKCKIEDEEKDAFIYTLTLDGPIPSTFDINLPTYIETRNIKGGSKNEFFYDPEYCGKPSYDGNVMNLLSESGNVQESVTHKVIGTEVNDFRTLDYNEIFTVTTAALKEVNEQLKAEKIKTATLETKYEELLKRVEAIENP